MRAQSQFQADYLCRCTMEIFSYPFLCDTPQCFTVSRLLLKWRLYNFDVWIWREKERKRWHPISTLELGFLRLYLFALRSPEWEKMVKLCRKDGKEYFSLVGGTSDKTKDDKKKKNNDDKKKFFLLSAILCDTFSLFFVGGGGEETQTCTICMSFIGAHVHCQGTWQN